MEMNPCLKCAGCEHTKEPGEPLACLECENNSNYIAEKPAPAPVPVADDTARKLIGDIMCVLFMNGSINHDEFDKRGFTKRAVDLQAVLSDKPSPVADEKPEEIEQLIQTIFDCENDRLSAQMSGLETGWEHPNTPAHFKKILALAKKFRHRITEGGK